MFGCSFAFLANIAWFHASNDLDKACIIETGLVGLFVLGLVYQGGYENTALYWVFPFPAIIFGLLGSKVGLQINGLLMLILGVMLYQPHLLVAQYKDAEISRFLASMATVIAVGWINEHFRERSHNAMELLQRSKETQANTDALTHLANRRFVDEVLPQHFALQPEHFFPLAVIIADLDHFKHINDSFGHDQGDLVLQQIAMLFRQKLRTEDIACRYGGEEFLLLLPKTSLKDAMRVADKIRAGIAQRRLLTDHPDLVITCSFGVAMAQNDIEFLQTIKLADQRLYLSKSNGRNQVN
ncbi:MAG: GGDEF domain-containing protein [Gammaproteobacteria bacterium]|nr:GGDEF domain-containing protein [Gammaproteobacteria bacterium]